jgi:hypothetical protein
MPEFNPYALNAVSQPGVRRDGTTFASPFYTDAQWCRFQRGLPRKMGGYAAISDVVDSPVRAVHLDSRGGLNRAHLFSPQGIEQVTFDNYGAGAGLIDRTPSGFVSGDDYVWQADTLYDAGGSGTVLLSAVATQSLAAIDDDTPCQVYYGDVTDSGILVPLTDNGTPLKVSGGLCVLQPFLFLYGSNGLIKNSTANDITSAAAWTISVATFANEGNFAATKIVKGLPIRGGGNAPAGLFWALDSLIRVSFVGGSAVWKYDPQGGVTVLSSNAIVEYDGVYYWPGVDRFYTYSGVVQELPNAMNLNWFFDNLDPTKRQKVWAIKVPRWGEIWWLFPFGDSDECSHAIIYNVREQTWYDTRVARSAGAPPGVFVSPIMAGGNTEDTVRIGYTGATGAFAVGDVVKGQTSGATGTIRKVRDDALNLIQVSNVFADGETIRNTQHTVTATTTTEPDDQPLDALWRHERGTDQILRDQVTAIDSWFETAGFELLTGGPGANAITGTDVQTRVTRFEPDFVMSGELSVEIVGKRYAQSAETQISEAQSFGATSEFVSEHSGNRQVTMRIRSNEAGGHYEMGKPLVSIEPGDEMP